MKNMDKINSLLPESGYATTCQPEELFNKTNWSLFSAKARPNSLILDATGHPIRDANPRILTLTWNAGDLIAHARQNPPEPVIEGILNVGDILLLHGSEESFKSVLVLQVAADIALGGRFLNMWRIPKRRRVGVIETEIHEVMLGQRLGCMFPKDSPPDGLCFMREVAMRDWRRQSLEGKFQSIQKWIGEQGIEILVIDTANDFFRGQDNPSEERHVGKFFDELRNLKIGSRLIVRHDRKKGENDGELNSNERIRGSGEWKEDPEVILSLERKDRRTNQVEFEVGKLRYGRKPEPLTLWFDVGTFRLTPLPPVIAVLERGKQSRQRITEECKDRFGVCQRLMDDMLAAQSQFLVERYAGHEKTFEINFEAAERAPWFPFLAGAIQG